MQSIRVGPGAALVIASCERFPNVAGIPPVKLPKNRQIPFKH